MRFSYTFLSFRFTMILPFSCAAHEQRLSLSSQAMGKKSETEGKHKKDDDDFTFFLAVAPLFHHRHYYEFIQ